MGQMLQGHQKAILSVVANGCGGAGISLHHFYQLTSQITPG